MPAPDNITETKETRTMYIKSRRLSYTALLAALLLWGCESDPTIGPESGNEGEPLVIENVRLSEYHTANTRTDPPSTQLTQGAIGVSLRKPNGKEYVNCKYIYQARGGGGEGLVIPEAFVPANRENTIYPNGEDGCYGYIYYPYQDKMPEITIPAGVCEYSPELDICRSCIETWFEYPGAYFGIAPPLLQHIWARLQITLQTGANYPGTCVATAVTVQSPSLNYKVTMDNMMPAGYSGTDPNSAIKECKANYFPGSEIRAQNVGNDSFFGKNGLNKTIGSEPVEIINLLVAPVQRPDAPARGFEVIKSIGIEIDGTHYYITEENASMWGDVELFRKILTAVNNLKPGEYKRLAITIDPESLGIYTLGLQAWEDVSVNGGSTFYPQ